MNGGTPGVCAGDAGIGFYGVTKIFELAIECDRLAHKHFIAPAPDVELIHPTFGQTLSTTHATLAASAGSQGKRKVVKYRRFIDNRLVAETKPLERVSDL